MCQCYGCSNPADIVLTINRDLVRGKNEDLYRELAGEEICPFGARRYTLGSRSLQYLVLQHRVWNQLSQFVAPHGESSAAPGYSTAQAALHYFPEQ